MISMDQLQSETSNCQRDFIKKIILYILLMFAFLFRNAEIHHLPMAPNRYC